MKSRLSLLLIMLALVLNSFSYKTPETFSDAEPPEGKIDKELILKLVNEFRANGCYCGSEYFPPVEPVYWHDTLEISAKEHSNDMYFGEFVNHIGSDGSNPGERLLRHGFRWHGVGENLAMNYFSERRVVLAWMGSYGHCKNIMGPRFRYIGVSQTGFFWTMLLAL